MTWQRARTGEQIEERIEAIVDATARLYDTVPFGEITFAMIARESGFTRSNLYKYFRTTEEVLLEILGRELNAWRSDIVEEFAGVRWSAGDFSRRWMDLLLERGRMVRLFTILHTTIERNASVEKLTVFKAEALRQWTAAADALGSALSFRAADGPRRFLVAQLALVTGAYPMWNLTPNQVAAMKAVGMTTDPGFYRGVCAEAMESMLTGLIEGETPGL